MKKTLLTMAVAALMCGTISAQSDSITPKPDDTRKKVAVVLSGGGAKGMAHIGVLKVLERAGIPIDIITGTSMGSIIGGLYAIGYNANSLDSMVRVQDWSYVITDKEDLTKQSLTDRKKQNTYVFSRGITVGKVNYNDGGFIQGKNLAELFQQLCYGYTDSLDFSSDLPIPFSCVATNVIDNSEYDFHCGRLPVAMRTSMAIPAAFSPVRLGDKVLVDGGLRNNYPADIAREMGADIIIGVTVQGEPKIANDMGRTMSILSQIIDVTLRLGKRNMAKGELTMHTQTITCPRVVAGFYRNDIDIYKEGDLFYNILYNQLQAELIPINLDLRHFNLQMGVRYDYMHYRNTLEAMHILDVDLKDEHFISHRARVNYNSEDNWHFPTRGSRFYAEYAYMTDNFAQLDGKAGMSDVSANWRKSFTFGSRFTLQPMFYGRLLLGANVPTGFEF
ncbi:MAG: patatin-like phospholipase family protein [Prevotella sp.]|nr:patatin-like phospholipase family protein [Prevotella sp.]